MFFNKIYYLFFVCSLSVTSSVYAQDPTFSQFYNAPIYLNPSFVGLSDAGRAGLNYRIQGNGKAEYQLTSAYLDYNLTESNLSVGLLVSQDRDNFTGFSNTQASLIGSYSIRLTKKIVLKPALSIFYKHRSIDHTQFVFGDQLDSNGDVVSETRDAFLFDKRSFFDLASGFTMYTQKLWLGAAFYNLLQPNISFISDKIYIHSLTVAIHGGYLLSFNKKNASDFNIMPMFNFVQQSSFSRLDVGVNVEYQPVVFGVMLRDFPISEASNPALSLLFGLTYHQLSVVYSYDFLFDQNLSLGGVHEISLTYLFNLRDPKKPPLSQRVLQCPLVNRKK